MTAENLTKGQKTQLLIIDKALKLYGQFGFANTSMQMIAEECSLSQGAVMQHFKSRERLFESVRMSVSKSNHDFVDKKMKITLNGLESLKVHMMSNIEWALKFRSHALIIYAVYESAIYDKDKKLTASSAARLGAERILRYIYAAQREKLVREDIQVEEASEILQEYLLGITLKSLGDPQVSALNSSIERKIEKVIQQTLLS